MKRIICILLILIMIFSSCLLTSCSFVNKLLGKDESPDNPIEDGKTDEEENSSDVIPNPPIPEQEKLNITASGYTFFCKSKDAAVAQSFDNLMYRVAKATGKKPVVAASEAEANVIFGVEDYSALGAGTVIGRYEIAIKEGKLYVTAGNAESLELAKDRLLSYNTQDGIVVSKNMNESYLFNIFDYRVGKITVYTPTDLANLNLLSEVKLGGNVMMGFNPSKNYYSIMTDGTYPEISATAVNSAASVSVVQATAENGGTAKITVTANNLKRVYSFDFYTESVKSVGAKIVTKNGAK